MRFRIMRTRPLAAAAAITLGAGMLSGLGLLTAGPASAALACNTALGANEGMINAAGVPSPAAGSKFTVYYWEESGAPTAASVSFNGPGGPFVDILASGVPTSTAAGSPNPYNTAVTPIDSCGGSGPHTGQKQPLNSAANWQYQFDITPPAGSAGGDLVIKMTDSDSDHDAVDLGAIGAGVGCTGTTPLQSFEAALTGSGPWTDTATATAPTGCPAPTGTVTFFLCGPSGSTTPVTCSTSTTSSSGGLNGSGQATDTVNPTAPGTYCFGVTYSGNYAATNDNTGGSGDSPPNAESDQCFTVAGTTGQSLATSVALATGSTTQVVDTATFTGNTTAGNPVISGTNPTVSFTVCTLSAVGPCPTSGTAAGSGGATAGAGATPTTATATSSPVTLPAQTASPQFVCFGAVWTYTAGSKYTTATDNTTTADQPNPDTECYNVGTTSAGGGTPPGPVTTGGGGGPSNITINRIGGSDRIDTADLISQASYAAGGAGAVVLARSDLFPDSLAGTPLAVLHSAPILLTPPPYLDPRTKAEIQRVLPSGGTVYLLGQTDALSAAVFNAVKALGYNTIRIGGIDRFATAADIGNSLGSITRIFLADGANFPDALTGAAASGPGGGTAIILTNGAALPAVSSAFLSAHPGVTKYDIGGPAANAAPAGATLLVGADRYGTAVIVAQTFFPKPTGFGVATGTNFPDALTAGPYLVTLNWPMLLTDPASLPTSVSDYVTSIKASVVTATVFGGILAVSDNVFQQLKTLLGVA